MVPSARLEANSAFARAFPASPFMDETEKFFALFLMFSPPAAAEMCVSAFVVWDKTAKL